MIYTVVCTDVNPYVDWQCELLEYTWKRAAQPGALLRLVTCEETVALPRHRHAEVLRVAPTAGQDARRDLGYKAFERLFALQHWMETARPEGTVLIIDPDVVFRRVVSGEAAPGAPRGQLWCDYQPVNPHTQAVTWPMLMHTSDLAPLLPRWIAFTAAIYAATYRWETDMHALVSAAAAGGLRFSLEAIGAFVGWPDEIVGQAPLVHYCQDVTADDGEVLWAKRAYQPWTRVPNAARARHAYCRDLLTLVDEYAASRS